MPFRFVDLYAGCGGLSLGLIKAGGVGVLAVEKNDDAFETLWHNLGRDGRLAGFQWPDAIPRGAHDIRSLLLRHRASLSDLAGTIDVVAGGPPCQGFSTYGLRNPHDRRNHLWTAYREFVDLLRPPVVVLENVEGIDMPFVKARQGSGRKCRATAAHRIAAGLKELGYSTSALRLCASDYGVPQFRPRLFLLGLRCDADTARVILGDAALSRLRSQHLHFLGLDRGQKVNVRQALSDLEIVGRSVVPCADSPRFQEATYGGPRSHYQRAIHVGMDAKTPPNSIRLAKHKPPTIEQFLTLQRLGVRGYKAAAELNALLGTAKHRRHWLHPGRPAPTITTLPDDFVHYSEPRILTVRECARLQSFPDWFEFKGKYTTGGDRRRRECPRFTQVGNAVPPLLAQFVGSVVSTALQSIDVRHGRLAA